VHFISTSSTMARNGQHDIPSVVGLFLVVLAMMSMGNLGLLIANSRDIYKINAEINAIIDNDSHVMIARPYATLFRSDYAVACKDSYDDWVLISADANPIHTAT
jgi:hypothetical protein